MSPRIAVRRSWTEIGAKGKRARINVELKHAVDGMKAVLREEQQSNIRERKRRAFVSQLLRAAQKILVCLCFFIAALSPACTELVIT